MDGEFYNMNDTLYNVSEEGGIQLFNLYTGERLGGNELFENKFKRLNVGISKTEKQYYKHAVKVSTNTGDDFIYFFKLRLLIQADSEHSVLAKYKVFSEDIYLKKNKKSNLFLVSMKRMPNDNYYLDDYYIERYFSNPSYFKDEIKEFRAINDSVFPKATPICKYNDCLVFFYSSDFSNHGNGILALVSKEGKVKWRNSDTLFKKIVKKNGGDNFYIPLQQNGDFLIFNLTNSGYQSIGIDLKSGITQFVYNQSYLIQ